MTNTEASLAAANALEEAIDRKIAKAAAKRTRTTARVERIAPDGTVWVVVDGSGTETPASNTAASVEPGDMVNVTVTGGKLTVDGNTSDPSAGVVRVRRVEIVADEAAETAGNAVRGAAAASQAALNAQKTADEAQAVAEATDQHFWNDTDGIHVTDVTQDGWKDSGGADYHAGHNILINSLGLLLRKALNNLVSITQSAIAFFDGSGNASSNIVASFGSSGAQIGKADSSHIELSSHSMTIKNENGAALLDVDTNVDSLDAYVTTQAKSNTNSTEIRTIGTKSVQNSVTSNEFDVESGSTLTIKQGSRLATFSPYLDGLTNALIRERGSANGLTVTDNRYFTNLSDIVLTYGTASTTTLTANFYSDSTISGDGNFAFAASATVTIQYGGSTTFTVSTAYYLDVGALGNNNSHYIALSDTATVPSIKYLVHTTGAALTFGTRQADSTSGLLSSSFGEGLIASGDNQMVLGQYNIADPNGDYALIVGIGTADNDRKNAFGVRKTGSIQYGVSGEHGFIFPNGNTAKPSITHWRLAMTSYGNLRLDSSTNGGTSWSTVRYFAGANSDKGVCSGVSDTIAASANAVTTTNISFPSGYFSAAPNVVVGFYSMSTAAAFGGLTCAVKNITTTGADVVVFNNTSSARSPQVEWIAFGTT